jgi:hypothetical protein
MVPHLADYDALRPVAHPYLGFATPPGYRSASVNTDQEGFRFSYYRESCVDSSNWSDFDGRVLVIGSSFSFGVGASDDRATLVSRLSEHLDAAILNASVRASVSMQEVVSCLPFILRAKKVIWITGVNNLVAALQSQRPRALFGNLFYEETLALLGTFKVTDLGEYLSARGIQRARSLRPSHAGTAAHEALAPDAAARLALERQLDAVRILTRLVEPSRLCVAIQPYVASGSEREDPNERMLVGASDAKLGDSWQDIKAAMDHEWPTHCQAILDCARSEGAQTLRYDVNRFSGWSFVDRVHMTDYGYAQAAEMISEVVT